MNKFVLGLAVLPFLAGGALAGQPLTDKQMDKVTAGFVILEQTISNFSDSVIAVNTPIPGLHVPTSSATPPTSPPTSCVNCYLDVQAGFIEIISAFGGGPLVIK